jgi:transporter family-2 protein
VSNWVAVVITACAGALVALQAPINSGLGRAIGTFAASSVSFAIGTVILICIALTVGDGFGQIGEVRHLSWYYLTGGALGAAYVTTVLVSVRTLGAGGVTAATISGQLAMSLVLDRAGILGLPQRAVTAPRVLGVALLAVGVVLIVRR